jgi:cytochrome c-type biogenesis protein
LESGLTSLVTAFAAGLLSVLSPCVLPLMPAYLSLVSGVSVEQMRAPEAGALRGRVMGSALGFVVGFSAVFVALGASATLLGRWLRSWRVQLLGLDVGIAQLAGLLIIVMGLHVAGVFRIPWLYRERRMEVRARPTGPIGTALVGAAFAFGWTPCVGPILGGILTLAGGRDTVLQGVWLLSVYSLGLAIPFLLAAWSLDRFLRAFGRLRRHLGKLEIAAGALLVGVGVLVLTDQLTRLNSYFRFLDGFVAQLEGVLL